MSYPSEATRSLLGDYSDHEEERPRGYSYGGGGRGDPEDDKLSRAKREVDGVIGIMRDNMGKVLDRSAKLDDLEDKSESLASGAMQFRRGTKKLSWQMWLNNMRWYFIIGFGILILILVFTIPLINKSKHDNNNNAITTTQSP
eukprot:m.67997 g.67997  ORF g.67997 m.67997 type:complete len:143 (-) comp23900_c0_seq2:67-495(-)